MREGWWLGAAMCALVAVAGCTVDDRVASPTATQAAAETALPTSAAPSASPPGPTGVSVDLVGPALAVTIATGGPPGSLAGLDEAGTVVEYPASARRTALVAVVRGGTAALGPLRAATDGDVAVATAFDADLVTSTASTGMVAAVAAQGRGTIEETSPAGVVLRDPARRAPFNVYVRPDRARAVLGSAGDPATPWRRDGAVRSRGQPVTDVTVAATPGGRVGWTWNPAIGWQRTADDRPEQQADGSPVTATTVVVIEVADPAGGLSALSGIGPAVVLRDGRRYAARWSRARRDGAVTLQARDGTTFPVDGRVWMTLCATRCAQQIAPSAWHSGDGAR